MNKKEEEFQNRLKYFEQYFFTFDKPIPFKDDLCLHPFMLYEYNDFYSLLHILTLNKNKTREGIRATHLSFLLKQYEENLEIKAEFLKLLSKIFHVENKKLICSDCENCDGDLLLEDYIVEFSRIKEIIEDGENKGIVGLKQAEALQDFEKLNKCKKCESTLRQNIDVFNGKVYVGKTIITPNDYNELRRIVCYQNLIDYTDEKLSSRLEEEYEKIRKYKSKATTPPSLEKKILCVLSEIGGAYQDIYNNWTIRKFESMFKLMCSKLEYIAQHQGEMSGLVSFKERPKHWIFDGNEQYSKLSEFGTEDNLKPVEKGFNTKTDRPSYDGFFVT